MSSPLSRTGKGMRPRAPLLKTVLLVSLLLLVSSAAVVALFRVDRVAVARGRLTGRSVPVRSPLAGRVAEVLVQDGQTVSSMTPLLTLESEELAAERDGIAARITGLQERLASLGTEREKTRSEIHPAAIEEARREIERGRLELRRTDTRLEVVEELREKGLATPLELEEARVVRELARVDLEQVEQALPTLDVRQKTDLERLASQEKETAARILEEKTRLTELERRMERTAISSPCPGIVVSRSLHELPGSSVAAGDEILRIGTLDVGWFEGELSDRGRSRVKPGLPVKIRLDGYPWLLYGSLQGTVEKVTERRAGSGGFPVRVTIDPATAPGSLFEGMEGVARIILEEDVTLLRLLVENVSGTDTP